MSKHLRIGIDARCLNTAHLRGMGKYVSAVLSQLGSRAEFEWSLFSDRPEAPLHLPQGLSANSHVFDIKGTRFHTWEQFGLPWRARRDKVDVLHCTATTLPFWQPVPTVVTIHDTLPWEDAEVSGYERWYWHELVTRSFENCRAVITISQTSRADILKLWPNLEPKITVIPHGASDIYFDAPPSGQLARADVPPGPYLLYVGGALERKRFAWAVEVLGALPQENLKLLACGFNEQERLAARARLPERLANRVSFLSFVDESEMPLLYRNAVAVLYPTLYEGFGLPVIESLAVGTPILFSALGSLRELQGPAAEVLPKDDLSAWTDTAKRLYAERSRNPVQREDARQWARQFSWQESASAHARVYEQVGSSRTFR